MTLAQLQVREKELQKQLNTLKYERDYLYQQYEKLQFVTPGQGLSQADLDNLKRDLKTKIEENDEDIRNVEYELKKINGLIVYATQTIQEQQQQIEQGQQSSSNVVPIPKISTNLLQSGVYGLPPVYPDSPVHYKNTLLHSFFIIRFAPVYYTTRTATDVFTPNKIYATPYNEVVTMIEELLGSVQKSVGSTVSNPGSFTFFNFAVLNGRFTETLSNSYTESMYQELNAKLMSTKMATVNQYRSTGIAGQQGSWFQNMATRVWNTVKDILGTTNLSKLAMGWKMDFPKIWSGSGWSFSDSFTIKLVAPSSDPYDILEWVIKPAYILKILAAPFSDTKGDVFKNPPWLTVQLPYIGEIPLAGITNLSITWGGESGAFTMDQLPLMADISLTLESMHSAVQLTKQKAEGALPTIGRHVEFIKKGFTDNKKTTEVYNSFSRIKNPSMSEYDFNTMANNAPTELPQNVAAQAGIAQPIQPVANADLAQGYNSVILS